MFNAEVRAALEAYYGLDRPLPVQYAAYLQGAVKADLGRSIRLNQPVAALLAAHLPWTLLLTGTALGLASLLGLVGGTEAAWKRGLAADRLLTAAGVVAVNAPVYFVGMMLLILFGAGLGWLPLAEDARPLPNTRGRWLPLPMWAATWSCRR